MELRAGHQVPAEAGIKEEPAEAGVEEPCDGALHGQDQLEGLPKGRRVEEAEGGRGEQEEVRPPPGVTKEVAQRTLLYTCPRCSSGATSPDRSFPTQSPPRSMFPRAARSGSSPPPSPAPSRSPSPPRPHLTIPQGLDGGSPLGDYVPFDKFRASRGQEPDTR